jgi:hypothetical protein
MVAHRLVVALLAALLVSLTLALPALAAHDPNATGCARAHECGDEQAWANPMGQPLASLYIWDPVAGYAHDVGAYGLVAFCQNYGGYYYLADDGAWYWFSC